MWIGRDRGKRGPSSIKRAQIVSAGERRQQCVEGANLIGTFKRRCEKGRGFRRRPARLVLAAKAIRIALPGRVVRAARGMHDEEIARDSEADPGARSPVAAVDVVAMKAVERLGVERHSGEDFAARRRQNAGEDHDLAADLSQTRAIRPRHTPRQIVRLRAVRSGTVALAKMRLAPVATRVLECPVNGRHVIERRPVASLVVIDPHAQAYDDESILHQPLAGTPSAVLETCLSLAQQIDTTLFNGVAEDKHAGCLRLRPSRRVAVADLAATDWVVFVSSIRPEFLEK